MIVGKEFLWKIHMYKLLYHLIHQYWTFQLLCLFWIQSLEHVLHHSSYFVLLYYVFFFLNRYMYLGSWNLIMYKVYQCSDVLCQNCWQWGNNFLKQVLKRINDKFLKFKKKKKALTGFTNLIALFIDIMLVVGVG